MSHHACLFTASMLHSIYPHCIHVYTVIAEIGGVCLFCAFPKLRAKVRQKVWNLSLVAIIFAAVICMSGAQAYSNNQALLWRPRRKKIKLKSSSTVFVLLFSSFTQICRRVHIKSSQRLPVSAGVCSRKRPTSAVKIRPDCKGDSFFHDVRHREIWVNMKAKHQSDVIRPIDRTDLPLSSPKAQTDTEVQG